MMAPFCQNVVEQYMDCLLSVDKLMLSWFHLLLQHKSLFEYVNIPHNIFTLKSCVQEITS